MNEQDIAGIFQNPGQVPFIRILAIGVVAWLLIRGIERLIPWIAERVPARIRLQLLPLGPMLKLLTLAIALGLVIPLIIEPTLQNLITILAATGLALGFAFKDYISSVVAGIVALYEQPYRPGDWVKIDGAYGEVRSLDLRAVRIVTPDDTVVTIPHAKIWDTNISNDTDGERHLQCAVDFYLGREHDARRIQQVLVDVALTSPYLLVGYPVTVLVSEQPWYTHYRLKAYPMDGRDQFLFTSDLTVRGREILAELGAEPARAALDVNTAAGTPPQLSTHGKAESPG